LKFSWVWQEKVKNIKKNGKNKYFRNQVFSILNKAYFIAKKIHKGKHEGKKVSKPIIRISTLSIALAVAVNIITLAVVTGFQNQVKDKVVGFGAHIQILKAGEQSAYESAPILKNKHFYQNYKHLIILKIYKHLLINQHFFNLSQTPFGTRLVKKILFR
jgi:hypothetical protein